MATLTQSPPMQSNGVDHPYTCNTCGVAFRSSDLQRTHMQSDWHRYNLKRRVAVLPPLTAEIFHEKILANRASAEAVAEKSRFQRRCDACEKTYYSQGAYVNHLGSQKHRILAARLSAKAGNETESIVDSTFSLGEPMEIASTATESTVNGNELDSMAEEEFDDVLQNLKTTQLEDVQDPLSARPGRPTPTTALQQTDHPLPAAKEEVDGEYEHKANLSQCLFCNYISPSLDLNLNHMGRQHGFFIPEREYLVDLEGLINYLSETITVLHHCLYCHKMLHTTPGVQTHMRDRGHCMIAYSTEEEQFEVGEFYDFRSTYSDEDVSDGDDDLDEAAEPNGGVSLGVTRGIKTTTQNAQGEDVEMDSGDDDEADWESDSTLSSVPTDEITSVPVSQHHKLDRLPLHRHHSHTDPRPHKSADGFHSRAHHTPTAVYHDDYELHLPSGRTAGHRSLRVYYRQNLHGYPTPAERAEQRLIEEGRHDSDDEGDRREGDEPTRGRREVVSRANGGLGLQGVSDGKKKEVAVKEKREGARAERAKKRFDAGTARRANNQKHFRDPLLQ